MSDQGDATGECLFCGIVAGSVPCAKVAEDEATFAFMDINPGSDGHLLVIPKRHSADLVEITADDLAATTLAAQLLWRRGMADRLPLPPARDPALSRQGSGPRPAGAAVRTRCAGRCCWHS